MKKILFLFALFVLASWAVSAQQLELKEVIVRSARGIEEELPKKSKVLVLNFNSPTKAFSDYILDELTSELLEAGKVTIVDRQNIAAIMNEMKLQYSGYVSDESMVSIGKMIGAHYIISGTLTNKETYYTFRIRVISIETATIQRQITSELKNDKEVASLLGGKSAPTSNVRNNWLSTEVSGGFNLWQGPGLSVGARYERMLGSKISLGTNFYWFIPVISDYSLDAEGIDIDNGNIFGIDASFRLYPTGNEFFLGIALGYHSGGNWADEVSYSYPKYYSLHSDYTGFAITLDLGWKVDVGKEGGFFVQPGFLGTFNLGNVDHSHTDYDGSIRGEKERWQYYGGYWRLYLGAGYAF